MGRMQYKFEFLMFWTSIEYKFQTLTILTWSFQEIWKQMYQLSFKHVISDFIICQPK